MEVGVGFDGFEASLDMVATAKAAEAAGAASLWFAQHMGYRDAIVSATAAAGVTRTLDVVPMAISPYLWHPLSLAMSMATLAEVASGRTALAVSVGNILNLGESGIDPVKPIRVMRDYVGALRALLAGGPVTLEGEIHRLAGAHMNFTPPAAFPIYVASTGPQMLRLAGEIADGALLSAGLTLASCRICLDTAEAGLKAKGRDPKTFRRAGLVFLAASEDGKTARAAMRRKLAFLFRNQPHAANIRSSGLPIDHEAIIAANANRDLDAATALLPDEAATAFGVAGTPRECEDQLAAYLGVGMDEPILIITGGAKERELALRIVREVSGR